MSSSSTCTCSAFDGVAIHSVLAISFPTKNVHPNLHQSKFGSMHFSPYPENRVKPCRTVAITPNRVKPCKTLAPRNGVRTTLCLCGELFFLITEDTEVPTRFCRFSGTWAAHIDNPRGAHRRSARRTPRGASSLEGNRLPKKRYEEALSRKKRSHSKKNE